MTTLLLSMTLALAPMTPAMTQSSEPLPRRGTLGVPFSPVPAEIATQWKLAPGTGLLAKAPTAGLTGEKAGLQADDILLELNGKPVAPQTIGEMIRSLPSGKEVSMTVSRKGERLVLKAPLTEKPRDPGNSNYTVTYSHITSNGQRMRTIISKPTKPGKHPAMMFIQGFSPLSYDYKLEGSPNSIQSLAAPIIFEFANSGYVTLRIEKPGVGDSEGGPFAGLDYTTELDIYRQALKQIKGLSEVDPEKVVIFGHSMGGAFGPMIALENKVRGIAVYGTASRTWHEYLVDTMRYQGLLAGATYAQADESARQGARIVAMVFGNKMTPDEVKAKYPELSDEISGMFPGGLFNQKSLEFWRQLGDINFGDVWSKLDADVLSIRGKSDFVTFDVDHTLIADIVNRARPGRGQVVLAPNLDHVFNNWPTEKQSQQNWPNGTFNPDITKILKEWADRVVGK